MNVCTHRRTEPVVLTTGETVGHVCVECLEQLPERWLDCDHQPVSIKRLSDAHETRLCASCGGTWTEWP